MGKFSNVISKILLICLNSISFIQKGVNINKDKLDFRLTCCCTMKREQKFATDSSKISFSSKISVCKK